MFLDVVGKVKEPRGVTISAAELCHGTHGGVVSLLTWVSLRQLCYWKRQFPESNVSFSRPLYFNWVVINSQCDDLNFRSIREEEKVQSSSFGRISQLDWLKVIIHEFLFESWSHSYVLGNYTGNRTRLQDTCNRDADAFGMWKWPMYGGEERF